MVYAALCLISLALTGCVLYALRHFQIVDVPNARSAHQIPTPRGGGWAIWVSFALGVLWMDVPIDLYLMIGLCALALISWADDLWGMPASVRWGVQFGVALLALSIFGLPWWEWVFYTICLVWWTNLYNFMDGIDGITSQETLFLTAGLFWLLQGADAIICGIVFVSVLGFLPWNWHKAKIFMGDIGSIPLGFITGYLLIKCALTVSFIPPVIFALYYASDATITLLKRLYRGEKIWQAHRQHYYQKPLAYHVSPPRILKPIMMLNAALVALGLGAYVYPAVVIQVTCLAMGVFFVILTLRYLRVLGHEAV